MGSKLVFFKRDLERVNEIQSRFNISTTVYKTVNNQDITLDVLIPKNIKPGTHPIAVRWHGGGLVRIDDLLYQ